MPDTSGKDNDKKHKSRWTPQLLVVRKSQPGQVYLMFLRSFQTTCLNLVFLPVEDFYLRIFSKRICT